MNTGELQNITGKVSAIFPNLKNPGGNPFLRAPYHSQRIQSETLRANGYIQYSTHSGNLTTSQTMTGDYRTFQFSLKQGVTSGTYTYPGPADNELIDLRYGEIINSGGTYFQQNLAISEATLDLEVSTDGRHLRSTHFHIIAKTHKEVTLNIQADFDIYLTIE